jgi:hypothetical protein
VAETPEVDATVQQIEALLEELRHADPKLRQTAEKIIRLLMHLYGSAFTRIIGILGNESAVRLAEDKLVSSLLLLHRLHPVDAESRIQEALLRIERRLDGARLSVTEISDDVARVRVDLQEGSAQPAVLAAMIERAVAESAPDIAGVEIEGLPSPAASLVQIVPAAAR